jgi:glutamate racemase
MDSIEQDTDGAQVYPARDAEVSEQAFDHEQDAPGGRVDAPIGVFDSGAGGLTVLSALRAELPQEDFVYFGDTAHCPYGMRSDAEIIELSLRANRFLIEQGVKLIVIACNTASQAALSTLRATFSLPFVGVVPAVKPAARLTRCGRIGVVATTQAVRAAYLQQLIDDFASGLEVFAVGCPELVTLVEEGILDGPVVERTLEHCFEPLLSQQVDVLVLGCTHFPALRPAIERVVGKQVQVIDSGKAVARRTHTVLEAESLLRPNGEENGHTGELRVWCSGDAQVFGDIASRVLGYAVTAQHADETMLMNG